MRRPRRQRRHRQAKDRIMKDQSFTTSFTTDKTPEEAFAAINNVPAWWTGEIKGGTHAVGDEFTYRYGKMHTSKQRLTEVVPNQKVVWDVVDSELNFVRDKNEWDNTKIAFDVREKGGKTEVTFTHHGLTPDVECYDACSGAWTGLINDDLKSLIAGGDKATAKKKTL